MDQGRTRRQGRPSGDPLDRLRTKVWSACLQRSAGYISPYEIAKLVDGTPANRKTWKRYLLGTRTAFPFRGVDPVASADQVWPGSAQPFRSLIWHVLKGGRARPERVFAELASLGDEVDFVLLSGRGSDNWSSGNRNRNFGEVLTLIMEFPSFNMLQALILLLALFDELHDDENWNETCMVYRLMLRDFEERGEIPHQADFFAAVDAIARYRCRLSVNYVIKVHHPACAILRPFAAAAVMSHLFIPSGPGFRAAYTVAHD